jgi:hypothetical protein
VIIKLNSELGVGRRLRPNHYVKNVTWVAVRGPSDRDNTLQEFLAPLSIPPEEKT